MRAGHSCFVPVFNVINSGFTAPQINIISWNQAQCILNLSRVFLKNECSISQNVFQYIHIVFPIWPVNTRALYKFPNTNPSNPQWTSCVTMYCSSNVRGIPLANTLLRISASIFIIKTDISFCPAFTGFWYQCYTRFVILKLWKLSTFYMLWEHLNTSGVISSLNIWRHSPEKPAVSDIFWYFISSGLFTAISPIRCFYLS